MWRPCIYRPSLCSERTLFLRATHFVVLVLAWADRLRRPIEAHVLCLPVWTIEDITFENEETRT